MFKKGDITINIIVVAVIALIVLVVLLAIFSGKLGIFNDLTGKRVNQICNGQIISINEPCPDGTRASFGTTYKNVQEGMQCCIPEEINN